MGGSKSLGQLEQIAQAALIEADPQAADDAARDAELSQGVWVGPSTDHGIKDVHIRTDAASATWFDASVDRVADGLAVSLGSRPVGEGPTPTLARAPTARGT